MRAGSSPLSARACGDSPDALASVIFPAPCRICGATARERQPHPPLPRLPRFPASLMRVRSARVAGARWFRKSPCEGGAQPLCHICRRGLYDFDFARSYGALHGGDGARHYPAEIRRVSFRSAAGSPSACVRSCAPIPEHVCRRRRCPGPAASGPPARARLQPGRADRPPPGPRAWACPAAPICWFAPGPGRIS